jgi:hypothetical protein
MKLRKIHLLVGGTPIGEALTWSYNHKDGKWYVIPTYQLCATGSDANGVALTQYFEVFRFGVQRKTPTSTAHVVGLEDRQSYPVQAWIDYQVHSANSPENGAWHVFGNYLIHDGPDDPRVDPNKEHPFASIGCIEICGGPQGFDKFNTMLIAWSGSSLTVRDDQLREIGRSGRLKIEYARSKYPPLREWKGEALKAPTLP